MDIAQVLEGDVSDVRRVYGTEAGGETEGQLQFTLLGGFWLADNTARPCSWARPDHVKTIGDGQLSEKKRVQNACLIKGYEILVH